MNDPDRKTLKALKQRRPENWAARIRALEIPYLPMPADGVTQEHIRSQVACLVWWTEFGGRACPVRWPHLDKYLNRPYVRLPREVLIEGLIILGYPAGWAEARINETHYNQKHI